MKKENLANLTASEYGGTEQSQSQQQAPLKVFLLVL